MKLSKNQKKTVISKSSSLFTSDYLGLFLLIMFFTLSSCSAKDDKETSSIPKPQKKAKIQLPKGIQFNMTSGEVLSKNLCELKKTNVYNKPHAMMLMCAGVELPFKYDSKRFLPFNDHKIVQLTFVKDRLRSFKYVIANNTVDFMPLVTAGKKIWGPLQLGASDEQVRKFNAGITEQLTVGWEDGDHIVLVNLYQAPNGGKATNLYINAYDYNFEKEIGN